MTTTIAATRIGALVIGGVEVEDHVVVCFDLWPKVPVYHRFSNWPRETPQDAVDATSCGRPTWDAERRRTIGVNVPIYHAETIGRPCLRCFPEAREAHAYKREVEA